MQNFERLDAKPILLYLQYCISLWNSDVVYFENDVYLMYIYLYGMDGQHLGAYDVYKMIEFSIMRMYDY